MTSYYSARLLKGDAAHGRRRQFFFRKKPFFVFIPPPAAAIPEGPWLPLAATREMMVDIGKAGADNLTALRSLQRQITEKLSDMLSHVPASTVPATPKAPPVMPTDDSDVGGNRYFIETMRRGKLTPVPLRTV